MAPNLNVSPCETGLFTTLSPLWRLLLQKCYLDPENEEKTANPLLINMISCNRKYYELLMPSLKKARLGTTPVKRRGEALILPRRYARERMGHAH